jgi:hypothetical protein
VLYSVISTGTELLVVRALQATVTEESAISDCPCSCSRVASKLPRSPNWEFRSLEAVKQSNISLEFCFRVRKLDS